jgi:hypothetical protein
LDLGSQLRSSFGMKALAALDLAAGQAEQDQAVSTLAVFLALTTVDAAAAWDRMWLEFGEPSQASAHHYADPLSAAGELWNGQPLTATCAAAIRAAVALADGSGLMPVPPGVLALCLVGEPTTAASKALSATSGQAHATLLELIQEVLVGGSWQDIASVLSECFAQAMAAQVGEDPDVQRFIADMGDRIEALLEVLNQFIRATTPEASGMLIEQHPELLSEQIDKILVKSLKEATEARDEAGMKLLRERRTFLDNYRRLIGRKLPADDAVQPYGECPPDGHVLGHSIVQEPGYVSTAIRCERCHVGCLVDMRAASDGYLHAEYFVFPADGCDTISREMTMWAVETCEGSLRELEDQGVPVKRSTPVIGWRPESLPRHTVFTRDG